MKTLPSLIAICALGWALQLKFQEIPSLNSTIESLEEEAQDREESLSLFKFKNKEYQKKIDSLEAEAPVYKSMEEIHAAFDVHQNFDVLQKDMAALKLFYKGTINKSREKDEKDAEFMRKKYSFRPKVNFRI